MWSRLFVYEADAQQYENLFIKIMGAYKKGFQPVKPHGNIGDRGNDGWVKDEGIYYQVYAPEDITKNSLDFNLWLKHFPWKNFLKKQKR